MIGIVQAKNDFIKNLLEKTVKPHMSIKYVILGILNVWTRKSKIDAAVKMITDLQTSVLSTEKQISDLKAENERLSQE